MPEHIFKYTDLLPLEQQPLQGRYHLLIVGTFNPLIDNNHAQWFYGRPENEFWYLLPRMMGCQSLHPADTDDNLQHSSEKWRQFCAEKKILIIDIFKDVFIDLPNFADKHLYKLIPEQYSRFLFEQAFVNTTFDGILFSWKGMQSNRLTTIKQEYINYFQPRGSHIMHMITPSMAYAEARYLKLQLWRQQYNPIMNL